MSTPGPAAAASTGRISQTIESVSKVVAPLTVVTALLTYIGWARARAFYGYFGLTPSLVSFSPQDFLLRSADVGFGGILLLSLAYSIILVIDQATSVERTVRLYLNVAL